MTLRKSFTVIVAGTMLPGCLLAQDVIQKDSVVNTKEEKNRNVMLNASATD